MTFESLGLAPVLLRALDALGHHQPTPVQAAAIPQAIKGLDLLAAAQTGTGKTGGFALPLLHRLFTTTETGRRPARHPRALIITPTRELAAQVHDHLRAYAHYLPLRSTTIFGGVGMGNQLKILARGVDVLVATPGRLLDHLGRGSIDLSHVEILVLDEADRMLDMGFLPALKRIMASVPRTRQTLLFSATFPPAIKALAQQFMRDPVDIQIARPNAVATTVSHRIHPVDGPRKRELLLHLLAEDSRQQTLIFSRTKHGSDKLCKHLANAGFRAAAIHGNKSQNQRTRALADFKSGKITILVATDIAARGLDIKQLPVVINHDLPQVAEDYVHRIGRTGRAGAEGLAISLVSHEEASQLRDIVRLLKQEISIEPIAGFEPSQPLRMTTAPSSRPGKSGPRWQRPASNEPIAHRRRRHPQHPAAKFKRT